MVDSCLPTGISSQDELIHLFFKEYKTLEGKKTKVLGWEDAEKAYKTLYQPIGLYKRKFY